MRAREIRNIDKVPLLFVQFEECAKVVAMVVRSALASDREDMRTAYHFIDDNARVMSNEALQAVIDEIDAVKETDSEMLTLICCTVLREQQRRRDGN